MRRRQRGGIAMFFLMMFALRAAVAILAYMRRELEELAYAQRRPSTSSEIQIKHVPF